MIRAAALAVWLLLASPAICQNLSASTLYIANASVDARTSEDLAAVLAASTTPLLPADLWRDAVVVGASELGGEVTGRAVIVRLMEAALLKTGSDPDSLPLDELSADDIAASQRALGFPDTGDLLLYLLLKGPSVREEFNRTRYTAMRIILSTEDPPAHLIQQRTDEPYLDLGPEYSMDIVSPEDDPVTVSPGERSESRQLNLAALPPIVLIAKAMRAAERANEEDKVYPLILAAQAARQALMADANEFRTTEYLVELKLSQALASYHGTDDVVLYEAQSSRGELASAAFFARQFSSAEAAYRAAISPDGHDRNAAWSAWGEAISRFAYGADGSAGFEKVVDLLGPDTAGFGIMLSFLLGYIPATEASKFADAETWRKKITDFFGDDPARPDIQTSFSLEMDFSRIMGTIGRPDIAGRFLADRLRVYRGTELEREYLFHLAAMTNDYCDLVSFEMSPASDWVRRETTGYDAMLDFVDNNNAKGEPVAPGEVVVSDGSYVPYSALTPEEDCVTAASVYGIVAFDTQGAIVSPTSPDIWADMIAPFEHWVVTSMSRTTPKPSLAPYLKLIWIEWFNQAFEALKRPDTTPETFHYAPLGASKLTDVETVRALLTSPVATERQKDLIRLFLETRDLLSELYG